MGKNEIVIKFLGDDSKLNKVFKNVDAQADGFSAKVGRSFSGMKVAAGAALAGAGVAAVAFGKSVIDAAIESQKVTRQTEAVLKSMGGQAGLTAGDVAKLSTQLSMMSGVDDEVIQSAENVLLTFGKVRNETGKGNDIFDRATKSALDMSVALGVDMQGATIQVGKALNDPIKGITALSRAGVSFTKDQQETIKTLVKQGDTLGAQKIILKELENQFGGSAAAQATAGDKLKVIWGNLQEQLGGALLPVLEKVAGFLANNLPAAIDKVTGVVSTAWNVFNNTFLRNLFGDDPDVTDSGFAATLERAGMSVRNFVEQVRPLVEQIVTFFTEKFQQIKAFIDEVMPQIQEAIGHVIAVIQTAWSVFGDDILRVATEVWSQVQVVIETVIGTIEGIIQFWLAVINGDWGKAWDALKGIVSTVFDGIKATIGNAIGVIIGLLGGVGDAVRRVAHGMWDGILDAFRSVINSVIGLWNKFTGKLKIPAVGVGPFKTPEVDIGSSLHITPLASGGVVKARAGGTLALLGEGGQDEAVVPLSRSGLMGGITIVVQTGQTLSTDRDIEHAVVEALESFFGRGGAVGDGRGRFLKPA